MPEGRAVVSRKWPVGLRDHVPAEWTCERSTVLLPARFRRYARVDTAQSKPTDVLCRTATRRMARPRGVSPLQTTGRPTC
jgi:hypothetical protein